MKFGQLIVHNLRNISVEKSYTKCDGETIPWPFIKKSKLSIYLDQYSSFIYFIFIVCQVEDYQKGLKLSCISLAFASNKAFSKIICIIFAWFLKRNISLVVLLPDQFSMSGCVYFVRYWQICVL